MRLYQARPKIREGWRPAFTTMEMIVALAVFSLVMVAATDIFFTATRAHRKLVASQSVQRDMRFAVDTMVQQMRQDSIDYDYYVSNNLSLKTGSQVQAASILALRDPAGGAVRWRVADVGGGVLQLQVSRGEVDNWQSLLSDNIKLNLVQFYIVPDTDPFALSAAAPNEQPRLTIVISAQALPNSPLDTPVSFFLQTSVVSRIYRR